MDFDEASESTSPNAVLASKVLNRDHRTMIQSVKKLRIARSLGKLVLGATMLYASVGRLTAQQADAPAQEDLLRKIAAEVQHGDFQTALKSSGSALRSTPRDYRLWTLRGMAYSGLQDKPSSLDAFEHALKSAPYYLPALEGAAQSDYQKGDQSARPLLLRILFLRPNDATTHGMLAILDYKKNASHAEAGHENHGRLWHWHGLHRPAPQRRAAAGFRCEDRGSCSQRQATVALLNILYFAFRLDSSPGMVAGTASHSGERTERSPGRDLA